MILFDKHKASGPLPLAHSSYDSLFETRSDRKSLFPRRSSIFNLRASSSPQHIAVRLSLLSFFIMTLFVLWDIVRAWSNRVELRRDIDLAQFDVPAGALRANPAYWRDLERKDGSWWWSGGQDVSPWDWKAGEGAGMRDIKRRGRGKDGKIRVLALIDFQDYITRMNTHTPELISAALAHPDLETDAWGPGWKGWDSSLMLSENLAKRRLLIERSDTAIPSHMEHAVQKRQKRDGPEETKVLGEVGCGYYDLVWTISDIFKVDDPRLDHPGCGTIFAQQLGDCHADDCINKWYARQLNITVVKYPHELMDMLHPERINKRFPGMQMHLFGHSPDSANRWDFYPVEKWEDKKVDVQGFGFDGSLYPIRTTVTNARKGYGSSTDIAWFEHPGYELPTKTPEEPPEWYEDKSPLLKNHEKTREAFATALRETRICIFDSSLERKMIRKYAQAFMSGCVVAGDYPTDKEEDICEFMIELKQDWSIEHINRVLKDALQDEEELQRKAMLGFAFARTHLTNTRKVDGMLRLWDGHNRGWRGYHFPTGYTLRCRQYWQGDSSYRPPWCARQGPMGLEGEWDRAHLPSLTKR
ncbi:hypothetical protein [Phaffia rhodozyma]|uniref:Uncharacterized protein n=1 Tax=Phaffia rhodozyma TaxID=264483 RepID=A0A0F7SLR5_PHARH|nr:hypothetical protein [Phaffia rhodozyma]